MKRLITAALAALLLMACAACAGRPIEDSTPPSEASAGLFAMDTYLSLTAYGENAEAALEQAQNRIRTLERLWSVTEEHSEIYAANHRERGAILAHPGSRHRRARPERAGADRRCQQRKQTVRRSLYRSLCHGIG